MSQARKGLTPAEIYAQQKADAETDQQRQVRPAQAVAVKAAPTVTAPQRAVAPIENRQQYIDEIAPNSIAGRLVKFDKSGRFVTSDDSVPIDDTRDFVALCDETLIGWIKFSSDGNTPPERHGGLLYDGFLMPPRESLGDNDPAAWPVGLSGTAVDPWQHQILTVLEDRVSHELFTFATSSRTGRRAVGNLLRYYDRIAKQGADAYPVVRLKSGGFEHKDPRIGFVPTPNFAIVGQAPKASAMRPDSSARADLQDEIPF